MATDYVADLMHPEQVAVICNCAPGFILKSARNGTLCARRIGRVWRFVPGEVALWQKKKWAARACQMNGNPQKTNSISTDE
jgi:hypothetical protein